MYTIAVDRPRNLVHVTLAGTMPVTEVHAYMDDLVAAMVRDRIREGYRLLLDVSACPIQTQDMIRTMGMRMAAMPKASVIAVVSGSALARLQIRRLFVQDYARTVATIEAGWDWVLDGTEPTDDAATAGRPHGATA